MYLYGPDGLAQRVPGDNIVREMPAILSGGGGLGSTMADYLRFSQMLLNGGALDGAQILSPRTLRLMTTNHLPGDLGELSTGGFAETNFDGVGFGLGFAVQLDPAKNHSIANRGEFYWGGMYSTAF